VTHGDGTAESVNLDALWRRGDMSVDRELRPGDVLMVPRADPEEVIFTGAVARAGSYDIRDVTDRGLVRALANVGYTSESDLTRVMLFRGADHRLLNARDLLEKGDASQDVTLAAGDVVYVPYWDKLTIMGAFGRPGQFPFDPKLSLMDYVAQAGGVVSGYEDRGLLIRPKADGTTESTPLDFSKIKNGILPQPVKLQPGDIIYVQPKIGGLSFWERMRDFLFTFGAIRGIFN
jgi:polysaccharide export outer membrane protein